jgi:hypothetical protein
MAKKTSAPEPGRPRHAHWDKVVAAAYLRIIGHTQEEAATSVGRNERTIREWESDPELWTAARAEARSRWLNDAEDAARRAVLSQLKDGDGDLGLKVLERIDDTLAPAKQRQEHSGEIKGGVVILPPLDADD